MLGTVRELEESGDPRLALGRGEVSEDLLDLRAGGEVLALAAQQ